MIVLQRVIDRHVGRFLVGLLKIVKRKNSLYKARKILIIKLWAMGDSVVMLPMLEGLRKSFPNSQIDVLVRNRNKDVFIGNKDLNNILLFEFSQYPKILLKFNEYDLVIDAEPYFNLSAILSWYLGKFSVGFSHGKRAALYDSVTEFSKKQHMVQNYLDMIRKIGVEYDADRLVKLAYAEKDRSFANEFLSRNAVSKKEVVIGISPGVAESVKARAWPEDKFAALARRMIDDTKAKILIIDSKDNQALVERIISKTDSKYRLMKAIGLTKKQFFALVDRCNLFVSNDAGAMHVAAAQGVKTIGLFGPNTPVLWAPYGKGNITIYRPPRSGPFIENMTGYMPDKLTPEQANCMDQITVDEVFNAVKRLMG